MVEKTNPIQAGGHGATRNKTRPKTLTEVIEMRQKVKYFLFSIDQVVALSISNPVGAAFIGWGSQLISQYAVMAPSDPSRETIWKMAIAAFIAGGALLTYSGVTILMVVCRSRAEG